MRLDKYYGTETILNGDFLKKIREYGYKGYQYQFRIVCKAKSRAEANRIAESYGLGLKTFHPDYTCETGNDIEIEMADKYGFIICKDGTLGKDYIDFKELLVTE